MNGGGAGSNLYRSSRGGLCRSGLYFGVDWGFCGV